VYQRKCRYLLCLKHNPASILPLRHCVVLLTAVDLKFTMTQTRTRHFAALSATRNCIMRSPLSKQKQLLDKSSNRSFPASLFVRRGFWVALNGDIPSDLVVSFTVRVIEKQDGSQIHLGHCLPWLINCDFLPCTSQAPA